jgi:hypothetical protein
MKKMIIPAVAALLFCGAVNAQVAQKPMTKTATPAVNKTTVAARSTNKAASVTPMKTTTKAVATKNTAITRKRHHKARKPKVAKQ